MSQRFLVQSALQHERMRTSLKINNEGQARCSIRPIVLDKTKTMSFEDLAEAGPYRPRRRKSEGVAANVETEHHM